MRKNNRHLLIKQLITTQTIRTQDELLEELKKHGVVATQATISRDIRDLKIVKTPTKDGPSKFVLFEEAQSQEGDKAEEERLIQMIEDVVTKVDRVQFLTILNTIPDNAPLLSAAIDEVTIPEKVCSLAGFDIVVIISRTEEDAKKMESFFIQHKTH